MDRRTSLKWVLAASAVWPGLRGVSAATATARAAGMHGARKSSGRGYGTDPRLIDVYARGDVWPLTLNADQRKLAVTLADVIIPADEHSPAASAANVVDFIDEWISAPYPDQQADRGVVLDGLVWLEAESRRRHTREFGALSDDERVKIANDICSEERAAPEFKTAARFFARFRDLCAGGFYSSPIGRKDVNYLGNVPQQRPEPPPQWLLDKLNLS